MALTDLFKIKKSDLEIKNRIGWGVFFIGLVFVFVLHWVNTPSLPYSTLQPWGNYSLIFMAAFVVVFLTNPFPHKSPLVRWLVDGVFMIMAIAAFGYMLITSNEIPLRLGDPDFMDMVMYPVGVLVILECTRRITGLPLVIVALVFIAYAHFGHLVPGRFGHSKIDYPVITDAIFLGVDGIFGHTTRTMMTIIWYFIIFGSFLAVTGAGKAFMDLALAIGGPWQGGPAQTAVIASSLFGTISGSGVANVATTGSFTIPLMKSVGYRPHFAGAIEASASMGGQIMPPVMGSGAFLMSGVTGIAYITICKAAILPAIFYYLCIGVCVYFEAGRLGLTGLSRNQIPRLFSKDLLLRAGVPLSSIICVVYILSLGRTPRIAAAGAVIWMVVAAFAASFFTKGININLGKIMKGLSDGFVQGAGLSAILACAGICVGVIYFTGIGAKFSNMVLAVGENNLLLALFTLMIAALFLGMGLPTPAAYLILAIMAGPALKKLGVPILHGHLLIFYYAVFAGLTPPVGIAYMAAAGIAGAPQLQTGLTAFFKLAFVGIVLPFLWIYKPEVILDGSTQAIVWTIITNCIGIWGFALGVIGHWKRPMNLAFRALVILAAMVALFGSLAYEGVATLVIVLLSVHNYFGKKKGDLRTENIASSG
ncbi:MAG: TRAP transporter fused permease subunit [Deltaproteobacteria bacterium]|nr:TRAP transporter fused permease subunit [Deltaproteobacteria bacterium]